MNSLLIAVGSLIIFALAYRFYGNRLSRLWEVNPNNRTPAHRKNDGVDFVPARHWSILFGHHFSSIAGAGPIIGPVIACALFGWFPALLWIILGSIFLGGVHDFSALMASLREEGGSIAQISKTTLGYAVKIVFAIFLFLSLVLVIAVFAAVGGKTLAVEPRVVLPTFGLILVAFLIGIMLYRWHINQVVCTLLGVTLLFTLILLGYYFPITIGPKAQTIWTIVLLVYAFIASVLPVNLLLQPRDYLATFILFFGLFFGYLGILLTHPSMHTPAFLSWSSEKGNLWPMLFVLIACGALSGFHSLIASGTTSKQLSNEKEAQRIAYGGMLLEGVLAVLALIAVCAGLYWNNPSYSSLIYPQLIKEKGWIVAFGKGYAEITKPLFGGLGVLIAVTTLKTFVMTTLDSATRICRYIGEELLQETKISCNRYIVSFLIILLATYLALGNWRLLWPAFGASNQLVAALVLLVITLYLKKRRRKVIFTLLPSGFIFLTTLYALIYQGGEFFRNRDYLLFSIDLLLFVLALFVLGRGLKMLISTKEKEGRADA
ncbi:MAG: carbon starvation protein A [Candidatus Omnitrophota bacterium]|nr:MAG: carbon starvation protein A [Candidatus Omnitrophota bacterium]